MKNGKPQKKDSQIDREKIKEFLDSAIKQIRTEEEPQELNEYRKIFRENVPFSLRSYFAAYMIKTAVEGRGRSKFRPSTKERRGFSSSPEKKPGQAETAPQQSARSGIPTLSEDEASTIFISVGKKRKVFPKDIIYMIIQHSGIERSHIGEIKILEAFSFVQILTSDAQKVVDSLSGIEYRGKKISASFARKNEYYGSASPSMEMQEEAVAETPQEAIQGGADF